MSEEPLRLTDATTEELLETAREYLFHYHDAFEAPMVAKARGATLWDRDGRDYLDFSSGQIAQHHIGIRGVDATQGHTWGQMPG